MDFTWLRNKLFYVKTLGFGVVYSLAVAGSFLTNTVTLEKSLTLHEPQLFKLQNGNNNTVLTGLLWKSNKIRGKENCKVLSKCNVFFKALIF